MKNYEQEKFNLKQYTVGETKIILPGGRWTNVSNWCATDTASQHSISNVVSCLTPALSVPVRHLQLQDRIAISRCLGLSFALRQSYSGKHIHGRPQSQTPDAYFHQLVLLSRN